MRRLDVLPSPFACVVAPRARDGAVLRCPDASSCYPRADEAAVVQALADLQHAWRVAPLEERPRLEAAIGQLRRLCASWGRVACSERILTRGLPPELAAVLLDSTAVLVSHRRPRYLGGG